MVKGVWLISVLTPCKRVFAHSERREEAAVQDVQSVVSPQQPVKPNAATDEEETTVDKTNPPPPTADDENSTAPPSLQYVFDYYRVCLLHFK